MRLGVIADDFTGATDIASFLVENGMSTVQINGVPDADYHLFITWATWTGKLVYRQRVHEWLDAAHHNAQARIAVYLVNMDQVVCR